MSTEFQKLLQEMVAFYHASTVVKTAVDAAGAPPEDQAAQPAQPSPYIASLRRHSALGAGIGGGLGIAKNLLVGGDPSTDALAGAALGGLSGAAVSHVRQGKGLLPPSKQPATNPAMLERAVNAERPARTRLQLLGIDPTKSDELAKQMAHGQISEEEGLGKLRDSRASVASQLLDVPTNVISKATKGNIPEALNQADVIGLKNLNPLVYPNSDDFFQQGVLPSAAAHLVTRRLLNGGAFGNNAISKRLYNNSGGIFDHLDRRALQTRLNELVDSHHLKDDQLHSVIGRSAPVSWDDVHKGTAKLHPLQEEQAMRAIESQYPSIIPRSTNPNQHTPLPRTAKEYLHLLEAKGHTLGGGDKPISFSKLPELHKILGHEQPPTWQDIRLGKSNLTGDEARKALSYLGQFKHEGDQQSRFRKITGGKLPLLAGLAPLLYSEWASPNGYRSGNNDLKSLAEAHRLAINGGGAIS